MNDQVEIILLVRRTQRLSQCIRFIRRMRNMHGPPIRSEELLHSLSRMAMNMRMMVVPMMCAGRRFSSKECLWSICHLD
jgi:hypothetical protein